MISRLMLGNVDAVLVSCVSYSDASESPGIRLCVVVFGRRKTAFSRVQSIKESKSFFTFLDLILLL